MYLTLKTIPKKNINQMIKCKIKKYNKIKILIKLFKSLNLKINTI